MMCLARLIRVVLGDDAIENKKLDHGMSLVVLGAEISFKLEQGGLRLIGWQARPAGARQAH